MPIEVPSSFLESLLVIFGDLLSTVPITFVVIVIFMMFLWFVSLIFYIIFRLAGVKSWAEFFKFF